MIEFCFYQQLWLLHVRDEGIDIAGGNVQMLLLWVALAGQGREYYGYSWVRESQNNIYRPQFWPQVCKLQVASQCIQFFCFRGHYRLSVLM